MRIGVYVSAGAGEPLDAVLARFQRAERLGLSTAWAGQVFDWDALTLLALASQRTRRIELGSWVVPIQPRHPTALAQQALSIQAACGGRLVLGLGVSHEAVVSRRLGLSYAHPLRHMREYLAVLRPLLEGRAVEHEGDRYRLSVQLGAPGAAAPPLLLAALGPEMLTLAGRAADGAAIWLGGPRYLETFAIPRLRRAAEAAGRPPPRIACGLPVALTRNADHARESAEAFLAPSSKLPAYRRVLEREGAPSPGAVAVVGNEDELTQRIAGLAALGVTDLVAVTFRVAGEPDAVSRTLEFLSRVEV